jgi:hypothetical protein
MRIIRIIVNKNSFCTKFTARSCLIWIFISTVLWTDIGFEWGLIFQQVEARVVVVKEASTFRRIRIGGNRSGIGESKSLSGNIQYQINGQPYKVEYWIPDAYWDTVGQFAYLQELIKPEAQVKVIVFRFNKTAFWFIKEQLWSSYFMLTVLFLFVMFFYELINVFRTKQYRSYWS